MFLSKKLLFDTWNPVIKEYYWETPNGTAGSFARARGRIPFVTKDKIYYSNVASLAYQPSYATYGLSFTSQTSAPTIQTYACNLDKMSVPESNSSTTKWVGYGATSATSGLSVFVGSFDNATGSFTFTTDPRTSYDINGLQSVTKLGSNVYYATTTNVRSSSGTTYYPKVWRNGTAVLSWTSSSNLLSRVLGNYSTTEVLASYNGAIYFVTASGSTQAGYFNPGYLCGDMLLRLTTSSSTTSGSTIERYNFNGNQMWSTELHLTKTNMLPVCAAHIGAYKGNLYFIAGPKTSADPDQKLVLIEVNGTTGEITNRCDFPTPKYIQRGYAFNEIYARLQTGGNNQHYVSQNGYLAINFSTALHSAPLTYNGATIDDWFIIKLPE